VRRTWSPTNGRAAFWPRSGCGSLDVRRTRYFTFDLSSMYRHFFRPLLFRLEAERAHSLTIHLMRLVGSLPGLPALLQARYGASSRPVRAFGLDFPNPVGLAAGYDKDALAWRGLAGLGFGHIEIGTVTPRPQPGNPRPRLFRLPEEAALINRMGFPGRGARFVARRLRARRPSGLVLGVNLGINKGTSLDEAAQDYVALIKIFASLADYLVVNVSSPNTAGLRRLQARESLDGLLAHLARERETQESGLRRKIPMLVKLSPDLCDGELDDALEVILERGLDGAIATNTTISREGLVSRKKAEAGGLSGQPLGERSTQMIQKICRRTGGKLPVIGAGGIMSPADAREKLDAGATLVQLYTGLVYEGPELVQRILNAL
jgi:dihydroorotate dehydrogenase